MVRSHFPFEQAVFWPFVLAVQIWFRAKESHGKFSTHPVLNGANKAVLVTRRWNGSASGIRDCFKIQKHILLKKVTIFQFPLNPLPPTKESKHSPFGAPSALQRRQPWQAPPLDAPGALRGPGVQRSLPGPLGWRGADRSALRVSPEVSCVIGKE